MSNPVRDYAWGHREAIADFQGRPPGRGPEAELWIGAHEASPSTLPDGRRLDAAIAADPDRWLGPRVREQLGDRLPFLMKILAVNEPLSLQVHPSAALAQHGHRRESAAGVPLDAPHRSYTDASHKPELLHALTPFHGLAGFREIDRTVPLLRRLRLPWADEVAQRLEDAPTADTLRAVVTETLALEGRPLKRLLRDIGDAARHVGARAGRQELRHRSKMRTTEEAQLNPEAARLFTLVGSLVTRYPKDPGVLVTLLLNHVALAPGESMFVDAGTVHAYLGGFAIEVMASSDNVIRAGLTPKHTDVAELLRITRFDPVPPPRWDPSERAPGYALLEPPVPDFCLTVGDVPVRRVPAAGPRTVLVIDGAVEVVGQHETVALTRGQSAFVAHEDGPVDLRGTGRVAIASVP